MTDQKHTKELFQTKLIEIDSLVKKITKLSLASADHISEGYSDCPLCEGEGYVETKYYENIDSKALTIGFFGIGDEHGNARSLWELLNKETLEQLVAYAKIGIESPLDLRAQLDELTKQRDELREVLEECAESLAYLRDKNFHGEGDCGDRKADGFDDSGSFNALRRARDILNITKGAV